MFMTVPLHHSSSGTAELGGGSQAENIQFPAYAKRTTRRKEARKTRIETAMYMDYNSVGGSYIVSTKYCLQIVYVYL